MKYILALLAVLILAQCASAQNVTVIGPITPGDVPQFNSPTVIKDSGLAASSLPIGLANPTGAVGLTTVNGVATTAMRSDAAPLLAAMPTNTVICNPTGSTATPQYCTSPVVANLTATTSVITPLVIGGNAASSTLSLESTSAAGTSDSIQFLTGSQIVRGQIFTDGSANWSPVLASINAAIGGSGAANDSKTAWNLTNSDGSAVTSKQRNTLFVINNSAGTGDGTVAGSTYAATFSDVKLNWQTTTTAGEFIALNVFARGGDNNVLNSGDTSGITVNTGASNSNNLAQQWEAVSGYFPAGSTTNSLYINTQIGSIRATGLDNATDTGLGFFASAQNGLLGNAFMATNLCASPVFGTCSKWNNFLLYSLDDGTHAAYTAFAVSQNGSLFIAGPGASTTNSKLVRVGGSVTNNLEVVNAAASSVIMSLTDSGTLVLPGTVTGTPAASLCLDASNNVIKKTTAGSCI